MKISNEQAKQNKPEVNLAAKELLSSETLNNRVTSNMITHLYHSCTTLVHQELHLKDQFSSPNAL